MNTGSHANSTLQDRIYFFANGIYTDAVSGGDIHFFQMAHAAMESGKTVHFFGGHALQKQLCARFKTFELTLTDSRQLARFDADSPYGQFRLFADYSRRLIGSLRQLPKIQSTEAAYAVSDYWFDVLPLLMCKARRKMMVLHMRAPSLAQILFRTRPDVAPSRLASLHYWLSQRLGLFGFRFCREKRLLYLHPEMRDWLLRRGYTRDEIEYVSFGVDVGHAPEADEKRKVYDVVWIGRVHRQKGIDDLLATLEFLSRRFPNFRAVLMGNVKEQLQPAIERLALSDCVELPGFVSEEEKFRLFRSSRVFLMPSRFEGSPRVIAEALVCQVPVVAYDVETYRPIFQNLVRYVPCFNRQAFQQESEAQVSKMRAGENYLTGLSLQEFRSAHSWQTAQKVFCDALTELSRGPAGNPAALINHGQK